MRVGIFITNQMVNFIAENLGIKIASIEWMQFWQRIYDEYECTYTFAAPVDQLLFSTEEKKTEFLLRYL
jgi:hypothetical protein